MTTRATSVTAQGEPDDFSPEPGFHADVGPGGVTRLLVSLPPMLIPGVHRALVGALTAPLSILYRVEVDRRDPGAEGAPPRDHVAIELDADAVDSALTACSDVIYGDARAELWIRGGLNEQVVIDRDGMVFCYPDDPVFRDVMAGADIPEASVPTLADRDYVKHWFHAENDVFEDDFKRRLGLVEVAPRG
jgi:hypothetical protein